MEKRVLAFDFGASSGRATLGIYNGDTIKIEEIHRFSNDPVIVNDVMYWDILRLFHEIKQGIIKANNLGFSARIKLLPHSILLKFLSAISICSATSSCESFCLIRNSLILRPKSTFISSIIISI